MSGQVTDRDRGYQALFRRLDRAAKGRVLAVGIHGPEGAELAKWKRLGPDGNAIEGEGPLTLEVVATFNEFGLGVPERSFIRAWADENRGKNRDTLRKIGEGVLKGTYTAEQGLMLAGVRFVAEIQARIVAGIAPANADSTIARKGSSTPLVNTGQLKAAVTSKIVDGTE